MIDKLVQKKNIILIICTIVFAVFWTLTLIFGSGEDKINVLVLFVVLPFVVYGFVRLLFKIIRINAPLKFMKVLVIFFLLCGLLVVLINTISFITGFPDALSPTLSVFLGVIIAILDEAKKNIEIETKNK